LTDELGFIPTRQDGRRFRYEIPAGESAREEEGEKDLGGANIVDVLCIPYNRQAFIGIGSVHHVAYRTPSDKQQQVLRRNIVRAGLNATPVINRFYFHSVYSKNPVGYFLKLLQILRGFR
jgi:glyoxalase family protein